MKPVYLLNDNLITSLGFTTEEHLAALEENRSGISLCDETSLYPSPVMLSRVDSLRLEERFSALLESRKKDASPAMFTRLEKLILLSVDEALRNCPVPVGSRRTLFVLSTTKGNIDLLENRYRTIFNHKRVYLWELGRIAGSFFGFAGQPLIISNACISGVMAVMTATRLIRSGAYDHAVVTGGDIASEFVISGFQSFQAISPEPCKPFDLNRTGLSLGEGCGTMVLSTSPDTAPGNRVLIGGGAVTNDANHISGPSRTGEELALAINRAIAESGTDAGSIGYISAHGTATLFNDEMESKAFDFSALAGAPVNSFKGYWGHTLGAAGLVESVAAIRSMRRGLLYRSIGYETPGVPVQLNVLTENRPAGIEYCLKTASGFGGCNAAIVYQNA